VAVQRFHTHSRASLDSFTPDDLVLAPMTPFTDTSYAVDLQTGRSSTVMAVFACGSVVGYGSFSQLMLHNVQHCCEKA